MAENLFKVVHKASEIKQEDATGMLIAMPVKEHILRIELSIQEMHTQLECSKTVKQQTKIEMNSSRAELQQQVEETDLMVKGYLEGMDNQLLNMIQTHKQEVKFLQQQCGQLKVDKTKVAQTLLLLDNQIKEVDRDMGFPLAHLADQE